VGKTPSCAFANAGACSGDDRNLICETHELYMITGEYCRPVIVNYASCNQ
jgi:hypothetical protein